MNKMYTKEDIEKAKQYLDNEGYGTGSNFTLNTVANLMAEYTAKNCVIPAVMGELTCDCGNRLTDKEIYFGQCLQCNNNIED